MVALQVAASSLVAGRLMQPLPDFPETAWRGVFRRWREIVEPITVCPVPYHYANLLAILSAQMGDFAVLNEGVRVFLNFYLFSYGRTGTKKSTAMDLVNEWVMERLEPRFFKPLSAISSAEGLVRTLATPPHNVLLSYDEIKHLFSTASRSGSTIESTLNKAFGLGTLETCVREASESLHGVNYFFNLMANGTPIHITLDVGEALFFGGLINRFLVFAAIPNERFLEEIGVPDEAKVVDFITRVNAHVAAWRQVAQTRGCVRVSMSPEARAVFSPWHRATEMSTRTGNELVSDPIARISVYAKKIAAMYCLWENAPQLRPMVTAEQMQAAIDVVKYCEASMLFMSSAWGGSKSLGTRADALAEQRIEMYLHKHGCANERAISKSLSMGIGETKRAVLALSSVNSVTIGLDKPATIHWHESCRCPGYTKLPAPEPVVEPIVLPAFSDNEFPRMYDQEEV